MILLIILFILIILLSLILKKVDKNEGYCVDISGGFKDPCGCGGYCGINN